MRNEQADASFNNKYEKIILFGASTCGQIFLDNNKELDILCFSDNDPKKWGAKLCGYEINPPNA